MIGEETVDQLHVVSAHAVMFQDVREQLQPAAQVLTSALVLPLDNHAMLLWGLENPLEVGRGKVGRLGDGDIEDERQRRSGRRKVRAALTEGIVVSGWCGWSDVTVGVAVNK